MFREPEISDNSKRIIGLLKEKLKETLQGGHSKQNTANKKLLIRYP